MNSVNQYSQLDQCAMIKKDRTLMTQIEMIFTDSKIQLNNYLFSIHKKSGAFLLRQTCLSNFKIILAAEALLNPL